MGEWKAMMTSREYSQWLAYARVSPLGHHRTDLQVAQLCNTIARSAGSKTKPADFLVDYWADPAEATKLHATNLVTRLRTYALAHNGAAQK